MIIFWFYSQIYPWMVGTGWLLFFFKCLFTLRETSAALTRGVLSLCLNVKKKKQNQWNGAAGCSVTCRFGGKLTQPPPFYLQPSAHPWHHHHHHLHLRTQQLFKQSTRGWIQGINAYRLVTVSCSGSRSGIRHALCFILFRVLKSSAGQSCGWTNPWCFWCQSKDETFSSETCLTDRSGGRGRGSYFKSK